MKEMTKEVLSQGATPSLKAFKCLNKNLAFALIFVLIIPSLTMKGNDTREILFGLDAKSNAASIKCPICGDQVSERFNIRLFLRKSSIFKSTKAWKWLLSQRI